MPDWFYRAVLRNQKGGAGETTFALRLGRQTARQSKRITLFDADQQGSALVWLEQRAGKPQECLFAVIGLTQAALRQEAPEHALLADHIIIDGSPLVAALPRSAALAGGLAPVPTQSAPLDSRASTDVPGRLAETRVFLSTHFVHVSLRLWPTGPIIARGAVQSLVDDDPRFRFLANASTDPPFGAFVTEASQRFRVPAAWIRAVMRAEKLWGCARHLAQGRDGLDADHAGDMSRFAPALSSRR